MDEDQQLGPSSDGPVNKINEKPDHQSTGQEKYSPTPETPDHVGQTQGKKDVFQHKRNENSSQGQESQ